MQSGPDAPTALHRRATRLRRRLPSGLRERDPLVLGVGAITLCALLLRVVGLGTRPTHMDEARVAYWSLRMAEVDVHLYRHVVHGPLVQHVTATLFSLFGPSDFLARLPVALVGGLVPLSALLFRTRLRDAETVALALLLAFNPVLLYYSRFMRSDVLVAVFMFASFGALVRLYDTRRVRYLYGAALLLSLGVASKENAALYVLSWLGGAALVVDMALFRPRDARSGLSLVSRYADRARERLHDRAALRSAGGHLLGAALLFGAVWLFLFATRGEVAVYYPPGVSVPAVTLSEGLANPLRFPDLVVSTASHWYTEYFSWVATSSPRDGDWLGAYERYAPRFFEVLLQYALPTMVFGLLGVIIERYGRPRGRPVVLLLGYAGIASAVAYPLAMDVFGPWIAVHVVVPLAVPAAVALGGAYRLTVDAWTSTNWVAVGAGTLLLLVVAYLLATPAYAAAYDDPTSDENGLVQFAQPQPEMREVLDDTGLPSIAADNEGTDVVVYGENFGSDNRSQARLPSCMGGQWGTWSSAMPLPWYLHKADATVECVQTPTDLRELSSPPPVVVTKSEDVDAVQFVYPDYDVSIYPHRTFGPKVAILVDRSETE